MKKYTRRHYPLLLTAIFVIAAAASVPRGCVYGSTTDWLPQHIALAETIRAACAKQGTLLPAFLPLGGGSNGFLFSYYGYLRPDILIGCVLQRVPMLFLVIGYMLAGYLASVLLFYRLLLDDGQKEFAAFWGSVLFLFAACFFHTHRQVMFVSYMPFLLAALLAVKRRKYGWATLCLALTYCNSFYYAAAVLAALGWYWYREEGSAFFRPYVRAAALSAGLAAPLLIPTGLAILEHQREGASVGLAELLCVRWNFSSLLYSPYGMGLTAAALYALFLGLGSRRLRADSLCYLVCAGVGAAAWILNGTLYVRGKILIPFAPLVLLQCVRVFGHIREETMQKKLLAFVPLAGVAALYVGKERFLWIAADVLVLFGVVLLSGKHSSAKVPYLVLLVLPACFFLQTAQTERYVSRADAAELVRGWKDTARGTDRAALYRADSIASPLNTCNSTLGDRQRSTMYSSVFNDAYARFYYDVLLTPVSCNNRMAILAADNPFLLHFMGVRYLETDGRAPDGYRVTGQRGDGVTAENDAVLPTAYLTEGAIDEETFDALDAYGRLDALMRTTVADAAAAGAAYGDESAGEPGQAAFAKQGQFRSKMEPYEPVFEDAVLPEGLSIVQTEPGVYEISAERESRLALRFRTGIREEILLLSFAVENERSGAVIIDINGIRNKLSGKSAPYPNGNKEFHYQFSESDADGVDALEVVFSKGKYKISNVQWHTYDKKLFCEKRIETVRPVQTAGNEVLSCAAEVGRARLFVTSIPVQKGMRLFVDGEETTLLTVNKVFAGAVLPEGEHRIALVFDPPGLRAGYVIGVFAACVAAAGAAAGRKERSAVPSMNKGTHGQGRINFASCIVTLTSRTPCTRRSSALQDTKFFSA